LGARRSDRLLAEQEVPALLVTHDRVEALALGDSVVILDEGRVCQSGPDEEVFARPATVAVGRIVGVGTLEWARNLEVRGHGDRARPRRPATRRRTGGPGSSRASASRSCWGWTWTIW